MARQRYTSVYELDLDIHLIRECIALPSANDAFQFDGTVEIAWQVVDPVKYVASGIRDIPQLLLSELQKIARPVTRCFPVERSDRAEVELQNAISASGGLGSSAGLRVSCAVNVTQEERSLQLAKMVSESISRFEREMLGDWRQADDRHIEIEKVAFYQYHLDNGGATSWALHLARHPEDSRLVMETLRNDQRELVSRKLPQIKEALLGNSEIPERDAILQVIQEALKHSSVRS